MIDNPVLRKELLTRYRNRQARGGLFLWWLILAIIVVGVYYLVISYLAADHSSPGEAAGAALEMIVCLQYALVCLITPSAAANSITQEKEQQTWEMLVFTRLNPGEIILGKLAARLVPVFVILFAFAPLSIYCWLHSKVLYNTSTQTDILGLMLAYILLMISAFTFTTIGLAASWWTSKTLYAIMVAYTTVIGGLVIGTFMIGSALAELIGSWQQQDRVPILWINPVYLMAQALNSSRSTEDTAHVLVGLIVYLMAATGLISLMIMRFRSSAE